VQGSEPDEGGGGRGQARQDGGQRRQDEGLQGEEGAMKICWFCKQRIKKGDEDKHVTVGSYELGSRCSWNPEPDGINDASILFTWKGLVFGPDVWIPPNK
jgi:hypothetical protein